jgi:hypothetical protein
MCYVAYNLASRTTTALQNEEKSLIVSSVISEEELEIETEPPVMKNSFESEVYSITDLDGKEASSYDESEVESTRTMSDDDNPLVRSNR